VSDIRRQNIYFAGLISHRNATLRTALYTEDIFIDETFTCVVEDRFDSWTNALSKKAWRCKQTVTRNL